MSASTSRIPRVVFGPTATRGATPHKPVTDLTEPGICARCHLVKSHRLHDEATVRAHLAELDSAQAEERRRLGEAD